MISSLRNKNNRFFSLFVGQLLLTLTANAIPNLAWAQAAKAGGADEAAALTGDGNPEAGGVTDRNFCLSQIKGLDMAKMNQQLIIHHIYIGQGDSTLIRTPFGLRTILIDGGEAGHQVEIAAILKSCYGISAVDYVVISHPHSDHFGGILELLKQTPQVAGAKATFAVTKGVYMTGLSPADLAKPAAEQDPLLKSPKGPSKIAQLITIAEKINTAVGQKNYLTPFGTDAFDKVDPRAPKGDGVTFTVIARDGTTAKGTSVDIRKGNPTPGQPDNRPIDDPNSTSSGILVKFGTFDYFTGGDMGMGNGNGAPDPKTHQLKKEDVEGALLADNLLSQVDVAKVSHHGSDTSSSLPFLQKINPAVYIISAGDRGQNTNSFHLPRYEPVVNMATLAAKRGGMVLMTSCGAGNIMPDHPFCRAIQPMDVAKEKTKPKAFDYLHATDGKTPGGIVNLPNFMNAQGDIVVASDGSNFSVITPYNPENKQAQVDAAKDPGMPFQMNRAANWQPFAFPTFKTDGR